jgi:hypothetical protein
LVHILNFAEQIELVNLGLYLMFLWTASPTTFREVGRRSRLSVELPDLPPSPTIELMNASSTSQNQIFNSGTQGPQEDVLIDSSNIVELLTPPNSPHSGGSEGGPLPGGGRQDYRSSNDWAHFVYGVHLSGIDSNRALSVFPRYVTDGVVFI